MSSHAGDVLLSERGTHLQPACENFKVVAVWMPSQSSCYTSNSDFWWFFFLGQKPCSQLQSTKEMEEVNFGTDWSGHCKMCLWKHPRQYIHSYLMLLLEVYGLHMKNFCKYLPKAFMVKLLENTRKIQNWTILMRSCRVFHFKKAIPLRITHCLILGCINTQLIKIICQATLHKLPKEIFIPQQEKWQKYLKMR